MTSDVRIGIIGGTGLYELRGLTVVEESYPETPWGYPSSKIKIMKHGENGTKIAFLPRHGIGHALNPSEVPSRANIAALKHLGVKVIVAYSAVGSLQQEIKPCDFVIPSQIIDRTKGIRPSTFFENGIAAHVMFGDPFNADLTNIICSACESIFSNNKIDADGINVELHMDKTLVCMEGPQFSTRAESRLYRSWGCDIINMTVLPEAKLAREAEIAYQMICMATDYDSWKQNAEVVTVDLVISNSRKNIENAKKLLSAILPEIESALDKGKFDDIFGTMKSSDMTSQSAKNPETVKKLEYILPGYF
ncbi:6264_t:CDS:2 [Ambispora gerdemannii]|uniref:S-methyl-5'-thioadenosine phosphorylase n=1 Tax=Ambispora gerdemannii TaxID=144530 RepID=A0A9N9APJ4_9GLOM|nr:6264_t:CDS:2 [Ambispora gerdemannii]